MPKNLPLPRIATNNARMVASDAWIESGCQFDVAIRLVDDRMRIKVGVIHLTAAKALAAELLRHWRSEAKVEPEADFVSGEPGSEYLGGK